MSSVGQAVGMVVGGVIGFFAGGNVMLGASIGGAIGAAIDPPKGPKIEGPRLDDLSVQTSTYGATIARGYGTVCLTGNIFWLEGNQLREHTKTEEQGGKGGGGAETTTYTYSATFAVGLMRVLDPSQTVTLRRMWIETNLVFDGSGTNIDSTFASFKGFSNPWGGVIDMTSIAANAAGYDINGDGEGVSFTFFDGSDNQSPHPRMQADKGIANVSGYPGLCYVVIEDLGLTKKYSNTLQRAQVKVEVVISPSRTPSLQKIADLPWSAVSTFTAPGTIFAREWGVEYSILGTAYSDSRPEYIETFRYRLGEGLERISIRWVADFTWKTGFTIQVRQSDVQCVVFVENIGTVVTTARKINIIYPAETVRGPDIPLTDLSNGSTYNAVFESGTLYCVSFGSADANGISKIVDGVVVATSGSSLRAETLGYSQTYLFCLTTASGPIRTILTIYDKSDLSLVDTITFSGIRLFGIFVIDDNSAYFADIDGVAYLWTGGTTLETIGAIIPTMFNETLPTNHSFYISNKTFAVSASIDYTPSAGSAHSYLYTGLQSVPAESAYLRDIITAECGMAGLSPSDLDLDDLVNSPVRGYRISNYSTIRSALEPLQAAFPFDVMQAGYAVRFVSRGGSSVASIPETDLGTSSSGEQAKTLLPVAREMDSQLHSRVSIRYLDPTREYDIGEQYAERPEKTSLSEWLLDLPLVMTAAEAAQTADILLSKEWVERRDFGPFSLPPTWRAIEPADVITVSHRGQDLTLRLTRIEYLPNGLVSCSARQTAGACYTSTATGEESLTVGQSVVPLKGSTTGYLLDIPRILGNQDVIGMAFGLMGKASGWPGGMLFRSDDSGNTWTSCGAMNNRARAFQIASAPSAHTGYSVDFSSSLVATPITPGATLYSVTEEQFYNQSNLAAYGIDGRWEIISFRTVVDNTGTYTLSGFLRGLYGTEWASGLHAADDMLIMLDTTTIGYFTLPTNALGVSRAYRAVTEGASIDSATDIVDTYDANNLKPLSPVDITGTIDPVSLDWTISCVPRTRTPVEVFSGFAQPSGETIDSYQLDVYNSNTFNVFKRTISSSTPSFSYTAAQQATDLGATSPTLYLKAYQLSAIVGRGFPLVSTLTRTISDDPFGYLVTSLLHFEGANGSTTITDQIAGNTWVAVGNAQLTTTSPLYGSSSLTCDGTGDYVYANAGTNFTYGTGDFTLEFSYTPASLAAIAVLIDFRPTGGNGAYPYVDISAAGNLGYFVNSAYRITGTATLVVGTRYRIAISRVSGVTRMFVNGVQDGSNWSDTTSYTVGPTRPMIGANGNNGLNGANGKFDEFRSTKYGRYAAGYTPTNDPFPNP